MEDRTDRDGRVAKMLRLARGLDLVAAATAARVSIRELHEIEAERRPIGDLERHRILRGLGLPFEAWQEAVKFVEKLDELSRSKKPPVAEAGPDQGPGSVA